MADGTAVVYAQLVATTGVTDLVGGTTTPRIYPLKLPQQPFVDATDKLEEAITFQGVSAVPLMAFGDDPGLMQDRVSVKCWAATYAEVKALAAAVKAALQRARGTIGGITVQDIELVYIGPETWDDETENFSILFDFLVHYVE